MFLSFSKLVQKGNFERPLRYVSVIRLVFQEEGLGCAESIVVEDINVEILQFEEWWRTKRVLDTSIQVPVRTQVNFAGSVREIF